MKKLKNNKGVTGIDIVVSVTLIVITLGIVMAVYSSYANKTKEVKRNSTATNLAMTVIEYIETIKDIDNEDISTITTEGKEITGGTYGLPADVTQGYTINAKRIVSGEDLLETIAFQIDVTVSYKVGNEDKKVTLSTIKKYNEIGEAEAPNMDSMPTGCIPVKYDSAKGGYVKTDDKDLEWYSISSKVFPMVVNTGSNDFDRNGVIQLEDCSEIYVWIPSGIIDGQDENENNIYRYVIKNYDGSYHKIFYTCKEINEEYMYYYEKSEDGVKDDVTIYGGYWQQIDKDKNVKNEIEAGVYQVYKNSIFTWQ